MPMRRLLSIFLVACSAMIPALALAAAPAPFNAQYEVIRNGEKLGTATITFTKLSNGNYQLHTKTIGTEGLAAIAGVSMDENSQVRWNANQPETISYAYLQKIAFKSRVRSVKVDAAAGHIVNTDKNGSFTLRYQAGVLDRHAVIAALMQDLALGKTGDLLYLVPDHDALVTQRYRTSASQQIATALGKQRAIRVERIRDSGDTRTTSFWFGQDKNFVPLRVVQNEPGGDNIEMRITSIH